MGITYRQEEMTRQALFQRLQGVKIVIYTYRYLSSRVSRARKNAASCSRLVALLLPVAGLGGAASFGAAGFGAATGFGAAAGLVLLLA
jgi:hypothetical protein